MKVALSVAAVCALGLVGAAALPQGLIPGWGSASEQVEAAGTTAHGHEEREHRSAAREELERQGITVKNGGAKVTRIEPETDYSHGHWPEPSSLGGNFSLVTHKGQPVTLDSFKGKPSVIFFGYAKCDDVCPFSVQLMGAALDAMPDKGEAINALFVSFDQKYETREDLARFMAKSHPKLVGLTGTRAQVHEVSAKFKVHREMMPHVMWKSADEPGWRHTSHYYLLSAEGNVVDYVYPTISPEELAQKLTDLANGIMPVPKVTAANTAQH